MSDFKWTAEQLSAITTRGSTVLVSAAAGSGKTAVLVERLLRRIVEERIDVTRFLIITFTKAAASELRRKIGDALSAMIEKKPDDKHLRRQLTLVGNARISTVHSFCSWVLKNYGNIPELAGGFRILDDAEGKIMLADTLHELIEEKYEEGDPRFLSLASYMSDTKTDGQLYSAILEFYSKCMSHPYPEKWLEETAGLYDVGEISDVGETLWGKEAIAEIRKIIARGIEIAKCVRDDVDRFAETSITFHDYLTDYISVLSKLDSDNWDELREKVLNVKFKSKPRGTKLENKEMDKRVSDYCKIIRDSIKDTVGKKLMTESSSEILSDLTALSGYLHEFAKVTSELCEKYKKEKLRRGVLEYSDLEHYAIDLLIESYDSENDIVIPSETGLEVAENFSEILLDEFQDSNIIQDIIFRAVSAKEKNIVMVGDVKQSIYGFRLADPAIFMKKYKSFKKFSEACGDEPRCITLSRNFRSRDEVIDASNGIFERIMTEELGGVDYTEDQRLVVRDDVKGREREDLQSEFVIIDNDTEDELRGIEYEAKFVAEKIRSLVDSGFTVFTKDGTEKKVSYGDFAVLFRSTTSSSPFYEREFEKCGIPYSSPNSAGLLSKTEINAIIAYLSVIDNPTNEVALLATLRSPLFGFSADDLCRIRRAEKRTNFFYALEHAAKGDERISGKCSAFLEELSYMRTISRGMSVCDLLWEIYNRTNALGVYGAMAYGDERQKNLIALYDAARGFENTGYFGLYRFISQITALVENEGNITAPAAHTADAVTIMTVHKSKGLEFPIVFIGNAIRPFNIQDRAKSILIHPKYGVGMKMRDEEMTLEYDTVIRNVISRKIGEEQKSEEMRLLYVAMTRAREKLFVISSLNNACDAIGKIHSGIGYEAMREITLESGVGAQNWFLLPLLETTAGNKLVEYIGALPQSTEDMGGMSAYVVSASEFTEKAETECEQAEVKNVAVPLEVADMLSFEYPYMAAAATQSKITATGISAAKRDERTARRRKALRPSFLREKKLTPAERGTALHMAMQFADFEKCLDESGARNELVRLLDKKFLSQKQVEAVDPEKIVAFANSDIGRELLSSKKVRREFKFSVLVPADETLGRSELSGEKLLLQGVIDMFYETDGGITIVDFKTDRNKPSGEVLESYSEQLRTYRLALSEITGKRAKRLVLYHATSGEYIEIE